MSRVAEAFHCQTACRFCRILSRSVRQTSADNVTRAAERTFTLYAVYGIPVEGVIVTTVQEACRGDRISSYRRVRLSTFGRVREAGFALLATFDHPHFTLVLADLNELTLARLDRCFDEPIPNPSRRSEG